MKSRQDVLVADRWNLEAFYATDSEWEKALEKLMKDSPLLLNLQKYQNTFLLGPENVLEALDLLMEIDRELKQKEMTQKKL